MTERLLVWRGLDDWRAESAHVRGDGGGLAAHGTQLGATPEPYRLDYRLRTDADLLTWSLELSLLRTAGLRRRTTGACPRSRAHSTATWRCAR